MQQNIPLNKLVSSEDNVRVLRTSSEADNELVRSIRDDGLMQNLIVKAAKGGKFEVIAGGRRLAALQLLSKEKAIPKDHPVPSKLYSKDRDTTEISLKENTHREAMHPADEYAAFCKMVEQGGLTCEQIANKFGKSEKVVRQRIALGGVNPNILDRYREGEVNGETVMAFTVSSDLEAQWECYGQLQKSQNLYPNSVRRQLLQEAVKSSSPLGKYVGKAAYVKEGGAISQDLFEEETHFCDREKIESLALAKLLRAAAKVRKEGWLWVKTGLNLQQDLNIGDYLNVPSALVDAPVELIERSESAEKAFDLFYDKCSDAGWPDEMDEEYDSLEAEKDESLKELNNYLGYTSEQKAYCGAFVSIGDDGKLKVTSGLAVQKDIPQPDIGEEDGTDEGEGSGSSIKPSGVENNALVNDLGVIRKHITKAVLAVNPSVAIDVLHYGLCLKILKSDCWLSTFQDMNFSQTRDDLGNGDVANEKAAKELSAVQLSLNTEWLAIEDETERLKAYLALSKKERDALVAYCVAQTLQIGVSGDKSDHLVKLLGIDFSQYWRPTVDGYLKRFTQPLALERFGEIRGAEWTEFMQTESKKTIVQSMDEWFGDKENKRASTWLPKQF